MSHITRRKLLKKSVGVIAAVIAGPAVLSAIPEKVEAEQITISGSLAHDGVYTVNDGGYYMPSELADAMVAEIRKVSPIRRVASK